MPLTAIGATVLALRKVVVEPLGVVRGSPRRVRRVAWRLVPPRSALAAARRRSTGATRRSRRLAVVLLLAGVATLLPWLVEATVRRLDGGSVPWQLAIRRLQLDSGASARVVAGIAVAVAGAIALQTLFSGVEARAHAVHRRGPHAARRRSPRATGRPLGDDRGAARRRCPACARRSASPATTRRTGTIAVGDCAVAARSWPRSAPAATATRSSTGTR